MILLFTGSSEVEESNKEDVERVVSVAEDFTYEETDGKITITGYEGEATVLEIPASINGMQVVAIEMMHFLAMK